MKTFWMRLFILYNYLIFKPISKINSAILYKLKAEYDKLETELSTEAKKIAIKF